MVIQSECLACGKKYRDTEEHYCNNDRVLITLSIDIKTNEIYVVDGDREPCSHGYPPCCDTKYIGYEWIKERIK